MVKIATIFVLLILVILLPNCGKTDEPPPVDNTRRLIIAISEPPNVLNPVRPHNQTASYVIELLFKGLKVPTTDIKQELKYGLAKNIVQDPNQKETYIVELINAKWHDGRNIESRDVVHTFKSHIYQRNNSTLRARLDNLIKEIEVISDTKLKLIFKFPIPFYAADGVMKTKIIPYIYKDKILDLDFLSGETEKEFSRFPVGNGPYKLIKWEIGGEILLNRNTKYFGETKPNIDVVKFVLIHGAEERVKALIDNKINFIMNVPADYIDLLEANDTAWSEYHPFYYYAIAINCQNQHLNKNIRKALYQSVNSTEIISNIWGHIENSNNYVNTGPFPCNYKYISDLKYSGIKYDPLEALSVIKSQTLKELVFAYNSNENYSEIISRYVVKQFERVGVKVIRKDLSQNVFMNTIYNDKNYDLALIKFDGFDHLYNISRYYYRNSRDNYSNLNDGELDKLLAAWESTIFLDEKLVLTNKLTNKILQQVPYIYLFTPPIRAFYSKKVKNVLLHNQYPLSGIEEWYISDQ